MSSVPASTPTDERTGALVPWAVAGLVGAAIVIVCGNVNVDHAAGENGGLGPAIVTGVLCLVIAAVLFLVVLPRVGGPTTQIALAVLSVISLVVFWSGATVVLGVAAAATPRRPSGALTIAGWVGLVAAALDVIWSVVAAFM
ncbi:MAG: hypothetical protein JOZ82_02775 [Marmoricola sp.]|nr:hypothetical protein [Marmoricola sp.]